MLFTKIVLDVSSLFSLSQSWAALLCDLVNGRENGRVPSRIGNEASSWSPACMTRAFWLCPFSSLVHRRLQESLDSPAHFSQVFASNSVPLTGGLRFLHSHWSPAEAPFLHIHNQPHPSEQGSCSSLASAFFHHERSQTNGQLPSMYRADRRRWPIHSFLYLRA